MHDADDYTELMNWAVGTDDTSAIGHRRTSPGVRDEECLRNEKGRVEKQHTVELLRVAENLHFCWGATAQVASHEDPPLQETMAPASARSEFVGLQSAMNGKLNRYTVWDKLPQRLALSTKFSSSSHREIDSDYFLQNLLCASTHNKYNPHDRLCP
jgi:hypothetical protein